MSLRLILIKQLMVESSDGGTLPCVHLPCRNNHMQELSSIAECQQAFLRCMEKL